MNYNNLPLYCYKYGYIYLPLFNIWRKIEYNIEENEKIIEKVIKNYHKSETVTIDKENLKEIYLENSSSRNFRFHIYKVNLCFSPILEIFEKQ
jgi:hypothetical protein